MQAFSEVQAILRKHGKCIAWEFIPSGLVDNHFIWDLGKRPAQKPYTHSLL
jgi:hypothetical protein